jgi:hypothetical protein
MAILPEGYKEIARDLMKHPDVVSVSWGFKRKDGKLTDKLCIVIGVKKKVPKTSVPGDRLLPKKVGEHATDIQETPWKALSHTTHERPCPPGFSCGHGDITAGTVGFYAYRGQDPDLKLFSNNHVLANSNNASIGDMIYQPGPYDEAKSPRTHFARLEEYALIRFEGGGGCNPLQKLMSLIGRRGIEQPYPNLVDAAAAAVLKPDEWIDPVIPDIGAIQGVRDLQLGDQVHKQGRTTGYTAGMVEGVGTTATVSYGDDGTAVFDDQVVVRSSGEFSQGGDSGSSVLTMDGYLGGLLFAGGGGATILNRITHVLGILGGRL